METHARVSGVWKKWDDDYDYNKDGESCKAFHPEQLATRQELGYYLLQHLDPRTTT